MLRTIEEVDYFSRGQNQDKLDTVKLEYLFVSIAIGYEYIIQTLTGRQKYKNIMEGILTKR